MRRALIAVLLALPLALQSSAAPAASPAIPAPVTLSTGWTFQPLGGTPAPVQVPHVFDPRPLPELFRGTTATYRLRFTPPPLPPGFSWALRFEQVRRKAAITLNGQPLGTHTDPYVPFTLPAPSLRPGQPNDLVVAVDNRKGSEPREGWWNWGGITRPVQLVPQGPMVLHDTGVLPQLRCTGPDRCSAAVIVEGWAQNRTPQPLTPRVELHLDPPGGGTVTRGSATGPPIAPGATQHVRFTVPVRGRAKLWGPGRPDLYRASVRTSVDGMLTQVDRMRIGLRSVVVRSGHLMLNGRRIQLRGASIQEDMPGHGSALTDADMDEIVRELKAVHANVTRAHYLLNDRLLDRLDEAGILVWTQAPIYHRDVLLRTPNQRRNALATLSATILAARNHASTMTYSVANELSGKPDQVPPTQAYLLAAAKLTRTLDPTLPVSVDVVSFPDLPFAQTWRSFDLLGVNSYFGWYPGRPGRDTARLASLAPYLRVMHRRYPRQALVMTEFGAEATHGGPATQKQTYAFQSDYLRKTLDIVQRAGFMDGAIYWTLREFAVKPYWDGMGATGRAGIATDSIHNKALIAYDGKPKPSFHVAAQLFAATPFYPGGPSIVAPRAMPLGLPGPVLYPLALLALLGIVAFDVWWLRVLRRPEAPAFVLRLRRRADDDSPPVLRRELDRDHVAVGDDVVAAFEA